MAHLLFVSCPDDETASTIARTLLQEQLAACINIINGVRSLYVWEGSIQEDNERLLLIKTSTKDLMALEERLHSLHPYDTPEFLIVKPEYISEAYLSWMEGCCR